MPDMLLIFISTSYAIIYFNIINIKKLRPIYSIVIKKKSLYLWLSVSVVFMWLGSFLTPIYFLPSIFLFTFMSIISISGVFAAYSINPKIIYLAKFIFLLLNLILFYIVSAHYYHGLNLTILIAATLATGLSGYAYIKLSSMFGSYFNTSQVLAVRFWLLWLVTLICVTINHEFTFLSAKVLLEALIVAMVTLIIPIYCSQKSINKIGPDQTSIWIGFTPCLTFIFEKIFINNNLNYTSYFGVNLALILLLFYFLGKRTSMHN